MSRKREVKLRVDGVTFRGRVPFTKSRARPDLGELVHAKDLDRFERKTVRRIRAMGLRGPESFRMCRVYCGLGVQELAELLDVDRRTVSRWEHEDVEVPKPAMALVALLAEEHSHGKSHLKDLLSCEEVAPPAEVNIDAA